ncbi:hypothetical protein Pla123a_22510 [Posidoniimonas polymericola]|uniref:Uncharacterized protein n=1 Tax=Posidoniimonas polymericola TaxID=2528002 RepID=A0A5C5YPW2_9BACT|nr:hypothetical protein Pla123a_22510 [Posidoniimonas polymericola]
MSQLNATCRALLKCMPMLGGMGPRRLGSSSMFAVLREPSSTPAMAHVGLIPTNYGPAIGRPWAPALAYAVARPTTVF